MVRSEAAGGAKKKPRKSLTHRALRIEADGTRTRNHRIDSPILYPIELRPLDAATRADRLFSITRREYSGGPAVVKRTVALAGARIGVQAGEAG